MGGPRLILLNGPPAVGKSTLARRYLDDHPLALCVDIDSIRTSLGQWQTTEASKLIARELGKVLIASHLGAGYEVVLPQLLMRADAIEGFRQTAAGAGAGFIEVILLAPEEEVLARFMSRRTDLARAGGAHPENTVAAGAESAEVGHTTEGLRTRVASEDVASIDVRHDAIDDAYAKLRAILSA